MDFDSDGNDSVPTSPNSKFVTTTTKSSLQVTAGGQPLIYAKEEEVIMDRLADIPGYFDRLLQGSMQFRWTLMQGVVVVLIVFSYLFRRVFVCTWISSLLRRYFVMFPSYVCHTVVMLSLCRQDFVIRLP